ncbi:XRE family transcriptional regulator [Fructilactobacillus myrtifloralis]|uniref:XRE family transcriptional regulator n=1 Tax=Fructilactobacillus myrtifloralis TaxID=2940301 RepID=A0ABY5BLN9_9LACO|nr:XRE family transcriptional regulator [Fructilactobacillus myrtifloralis]USS84470.1 XRE family transcriptional regulator [Fructilactobacillus myrtifloralis]
MKFNGLRLRDIREAFNLSRKDLSKKINVSEQSIRKYETGIDYPDFNVLSKLNNIFGVNLNFFSIQTNIPKVVDSKYVAYRSDLNNSVKETDKETSYLNFVDYLIDLLCSKTNIYSETITNISSKSIKMMQSGQPIDDIAGYVKKTLRIDNQNKNMMAAIEKSGVFIVERNLNNKIDAYSSWTDTNRPYIILGMNKSNPRRLFDLAHEFGHIILHHNLEFNEINSLELKKLEKEANKFASSFLLDKNSFTYLFKKYVKNPSNPDQYIPLKRYYGTSIAALELRAINLDLITTKQSGIFWANMNKFNYKFREPLDNEIPLVIPGKLYAMINSFNSTERRLLYKNDGIDFSLFNKILVRKIKHKNKYNFYNNVVKINSEKHNC